MTVIRALVFDVGETLIDETRVWSRWADRLGVPRLTLMGLIGGMAALGRSQMDALRLVRPDFDLEAEFAAWRRDDPSGMRENFDAADLYPDARRALGALREAGYQVVLAGNQPPQAGDALAAMNLPVDAIHTSAEWGVEKPDPAFFAKVVSVAGREPEEILYVGDRLDNDVLPARRAGMRTALLRRGPWGFLHGDLPDAAEADVVIDGLDDLITVLADGRVRPRV
ncbi:HAD family hydrolase [Spongiactinospora sp. TRM90649]|uniref:HAD family hydrolase n=1 Tax=Spongiactinospora sp. TRM90649 TaxID=3031114 RepID=UPI0023F95E53|nr:HAD family hydrolase [Spongiactinospora sp. TRM90649]MDF5758134.1 HAD family hydrolase [Spongiactinospora sp. TRM90649]